MGDDAGFFDIGGVGEGWGGRFVGLDGGSFAGVCCEGSGGCDFAAAVLSGTKGVAEELGGRCVG